MTTAVIPSLVGYVEMRPLSPHLRSQALGLAVVFPASRCDFLRFLLAADRMVTEEESQKMFFSLFSGFTLPVT